MEVARVTIRLDGELLAAVDARAALEGFSRSEAVRRALYETVRRRTAEPWVLDRDRVLRALLRSVEERGSVRAAEVLLAELDSDQQVDVAWSDLDDAAPSRRRPHVSRSS